MCSSRSTLLDSLVHYFQIIHNNDVLEGRGVQIEDIQNRMVSQNSVNETTKLQSIKSKLSCCPILPLLLYNETM